MCLHASRLVYFQENMFGQVKLSDTAEDDSNVYVFQISTMSQFSTIDIAFISGIDEKTADMEDRTNTLTGSQLTTLLAEKHVAFDEKFRECFNLSEENDAKTLEVGKAAIGNMLGGIGYLYGQSKVYYHKSKHHFLHYWPAELYTAVPCRSKLPWGQLSDEGFHQMLIWRWDFRITLDIVGHWLDLMNVEGWIPREQILGLEALREEGRKFLLAWQRQYNSTTLTVASGMDDYPWASHPSDDEMHEEDYSSIVHQLSDFDDLNKMHYDRDHKTYLDFGNHAEKVRLVIDVGRGIRVTNEEPELKKVPHVVIYCSSISIFIFKEEIPKISQSLGLVKHSEILEQQLDLISSNELVCSDYGLLSLAKTSSSYMTPNSLMNQPPCWRGPIWMNINYMILASLKHYSSVEGPYSDKARDIYVKLRNNLISNVVGEYDKTRYIWERYDQTKGTGEGGRNFTGWSALILLIMTEDYPRLQKRSWLSNPAHVSEIK
ncbi:mannosyl-oligosaccharide glucosidase GCS1 [Brassica napus]|uniref:mannosyl-oligosaccharide glucosidase GCS1 n=1 Tax=Brassica napus TaxID=3708 RepID=UPI00207AF824|nr:mannosyl-oligosaccharide glucosidase GCS1 [Brassica napus]